MICHLIKDAQFRDNPPNPDFVAGAGPVAPRSAALHHGPARDAADRRRDAPRGRCFNDTLVRVLIGEIYLPLSRLVAYYGRDATAC